MKSLFFLLLAASAVPAMSQSLTQSLDSIFAQLEKSVPTAHGLLVIRHGEVAYRKVSGWADMERKAPASPKSNFRMASVAKQFTAAAIALLEKQGKLQIEQPLSDFFPEFAACGQGITLRHLLTHSSGIADYEELMPADLSVQLLDADVLDMVKGCDTVYFPPGSAFRYSNTGFCLLALVVERVCGQSFADFVESQLFAQTGMVASRAFEAGEAIPYRAFGYAPSGVTADGGRQGIKFSDQSLTSATKGDGGLYISLDDYANWFRLRREKLGLDVAGALPRCQFEVPGMGGARYGWGWFSLQKPGLPLTLFHTGSTCGFSNVVVEIPEEGTCVAFFSNLAGHHAAFGPIYEALERAGVLHPEMDVWVILHEQTR